MDAEALVNYSKFSKDSIEALIEVFGDRTPSVVKALKSPGNRFFIRINTLRADREEIVALFGERGVAVEMLPEIEEAAFIRILGPFELKAHPKKIVVDRLAGESILLGSHLYAPGVKNCQGVRRGDVLAVVDEEGQHVANGVARQSETQILKERRGLAVEITEAVYRVPSIRETPEFVQGMILPQSLPAMVAVRALEPQPNEVIVDLCASPGGKTSHIAEITGGRASIFAFDRTEEKINDLKATLSRLRHDNINCICHDSRYLPEDFGDLKADKVLLDPPCSALGLRPKLAEHATRREISSLASYQMQLLQSASKILNEEGKLVYSTCTLTLDENEKVIKYGLEALGLTLESQPIFLGSPGRDEIFKEAKKAQRFDPALHDTPGYFIARLVKRRS
jgi:16S rRNA C967 or C1407 C5-methylase (RsmB/RsmF family)